MGNKFYTLKFRAENEDIFEAIRSGKKTIETRAATSRYRDIKMGDVLVFVCRKGRFKKYAKKVKIFRTIAALMNKYQPQQINPSCATEKDLEAMYYSFSGYRKKIKKYGLIAIELK